MKAIVENNKSTRIFRNTLGLLFQNCGYLFAGQGIILALFLLLFSPFSTFLFHATLELTGYSYVTIDNIGSFLLNPIGILMVVVLFLTSSLFLLFEIFFLLTYFCVKKTKQITIIEIIKILLTSLYKVLVVLFRGKLRLIIAGWMLLLVYNFPLLLYLIRKPRWFDFISTEIQSQFFLLIIILGLLGLFYLSFFRRSFMFHYFLLGKSNYREEIRLEKRKIGNRRLRNLFYFLYWNTIISTIVLLLYIAIMGIAMIFVTQLLDKELAVAAFITIKGKLDNYLGILIFLIGTICNVALSTQLFYHYQLSEETGGEVMRRAVRRVREMSFRYVIIVLLFLILTINLYFSLDILRNGSILNHINLEEVEITSHRGFSSDVPENTIPAVQKAINEQVDYVEIDVRVTNDGQLILLHDSNLNRTTGVKQNIWDVNYDEIRDLDAGSFMDEIYADVRIPLLEDVFKESKGKVYLILDLKYRYQEEQLVEKLVDLIEEYDMVWQCVVTSTNLECLEEIKKTNSNIKTGYIVYQLPSGITENTNIDFFSMKSSLVSERIVKRVHESGKKIFVWTVNTKNELERVNRIGVDNIISDNPTYAKEILFLSESDQFMATWIKIMLE